MIELLVVIAIITVLIALLLPALESVKKVAWRVKCASSLHQVGVGVATYAADRDGQMPPVNRIGKPFTTYFMRHPGRGPMNLEWLRAEEIVTEPEAYYCPSQNINTTASLSLDGPDNAWEGDKVRTSFPARLLRLGNGKAQKQGSELGWEIDNYTDRVIYSDFIGVDDWSGSGIVDGFLHAPHDDAGFNRLFGDGSARWSSPGPLTSQIGPVTPTDEEQAAYYEEMDGLP